MDNLKQNWTKVAGVAAGAISLFLLYKLLTRESGASAVKGSSYVYKNPFSYVVDPRNSLLEIRKRAEAFIEEYISEHLG